MNRCLFCLIALLILPLTVNAHADEVDEYIKAQMQKWHVPGLSLAIIQDGKIIKAAGYGVREPSSNQPVTPTTLFQAGSISKAVAAVGVLKLVDQGKFNLDEDVNQKLRSWKVPENEFTREQKVTLRRILSHTAGLTVHGFGGYAVDQPVPSLVQVLDGAKPANSPPIRVDIVPGSQWRYSGGGYTVMQQMLLDVIGTPFPDFMQKTVLGPLGMKESTYMQPLPEQWAKRTATGTYPDGSAVRGRWHVYPEMAAAGLWTTASDLATFAIGIQNAFTGKNNTILSSALVHQMLTVEKADDGLGVFLEGKEKTLRFEHNGRDEGFDALLVAYAGTGQGVAIMINSNASSDIMGRVARAVGKKYGWPGYPTNNVEPILSLKIETKTLETLAGYYDLSGSVLTLTHGTDRLIARTDDGLMDEFLPISETTFVGPDTGIKLSFEKNGTGTTYKAVLLMPEGQSTKLTPFCSLLSGVKPEDDPDIARTTHVQEFVTMLKNGGRGIADATYVTTGAKNDVKEGYPPAQQVGTLTFICDRDIADRNITRHGGKVARLATYSIHGGKPSRFFLVYLTVEGLITDIDIVTE
jgi:CubicO group peptidase (beta-lactamase class C family)